jgi:5-methylcytosine-specific restriction endonuclease McrA
MGAGIVPIIALLALFFVKQWLFEIGRKRRRNYYRDNYLKSDAWKRKRYVVLKRDNWRCLYCGGRATQVHHTKYAKYDIGKEPIEWLVSICKDCHDSIHR